jgi:hypothetical protein
MSADRDRGTRREKQKRAKEMKRDARAAHEAAVKAAATGQGTAAKTKSA